MREFDLPPQLKGVLTSILATGLALALNSLLNATTDMDPHTISIWVFSVITNIIGFLLDLVFAVDTFVVNGKRVSPGWNWGERVYLAIRTALRPEIMTRFILVVLVDVMMLPHVKRILEKVDYGWLPTDLENIMTFDTTTSMLASLIIYLFLVNPLRFHWVYDFGQGTHIPIMTTVVACSVAIMSQQAS